jgi:hypothetical protein
MSKIFSIRSIQDSRGSVIVTFLVGGVSVAAMGLMAGCLTDAEADFPPSPPDGVFSVTGDGQVEICWNSNPEDDIAGYDIYWNNEPSGFFEYVATVPASRTCFIDTDVANGVTYYYAVLAFDQAGQESELSYEDVFDTPRPEGFGLVLFDYLGQNNVHSGYDFSALRSIPQGCCFSTTDVYFGVPNNIPTLFTARPEVDVQDYGYIELDAVDWSPTQGWSNSGSVELIEGHSYIIKITDNNTQKQFCNYAKVYVRDVSFTSATLDWAYQIDPNNPELAPGTGGAQR